MKYSSIGYLIGEGFSNILKNKKSTFASIIIMFMTMFMFGAFFIIGENVNAFVKQIESEQGIQVFIDDVTDDRLKEIKEQILGTDGVANARFVSKSEALEEARTTIYKDTPELLDGFPEDVFHVSYVVTFSDLGKSSHVHEAINNIDDVVNIQSKQTTIDGVVAIGNAIRLVTGILLAILIIISIFIISNTIKLTVHARRKEISIMKYVGATNSFIRWPFIVEGIVIGLLAACISILVVGGLYQVIVNNSAEAFMKYSLILQDFYEMFQLIIIVYVGLGIGIGTIGSSLSMRKYLEV